MQKLDEKAQKMLSVPSEHVQDIFNVPAVDSEMDWIDEPAEETEEATEYFHKVLNDSPKRRQAARSQIRHSDKSKNRVLVETGCHDM